MEHFAAETDSPGDGEKSLMTCLARSLSNDNEWSEQVTAGVQLNYLYLAAELSRSDDVGHPTWTTSRYLWPVC